MPAIVGFAVPLVLIIYLALESGGYELTPKSQAGIVIWWAVLIGVVAGILPVARISRAGWVGLALLAALTLWTALAAFTWTQSTERSMIELSRISMLLGTFLLLLLLQKKGDLRRSVAAVATAVGIVAALALLSRFHPGWFPELTFPENYPIARLTYPLGYWNGLATLMAMGLAALMWTVASARSASGRVLAAVAIPLVVLTVVLTASRGGIVEVAAVLLVLLALYPRRLSLCLNLVVPVLASVALLVFIAQRDDLRNNTGGLASSQGTEMIWITLGVLLVAALAQALLVKALDSGMLKVPQMGRRATSRFGVVVAILGGALIVGAFASGFAGDKWSEFKEPVTNDGTVSRLSSVNSGERYELWDSALEASSSERLVGIGPGAFEFWWARNGDGVGFVRDAHSIYLEGLAELGVLGFLLVLSLVALPIGLAVTGAVRNSLTDRRAELAAAAAAMTAFAVAAGIDWAWEMTVLPVAFLVLAAAVFGPDDETREGRRFDPGNRERLAIWQKASAVLVSLAAMTVIILPLAGTSLVRESQSLYREGDVTGSLDKAEQAVKVQPYSSTAEIQVALLQSGMGDRAEALESAREATRDDPYNWRTWLVLSRIAGQNGLTGLAARADRKVVELNHRR